LYSVIPSNGNGDFSVTRATTATRTNASGLIESVPINEPRLDYSLGSCPNILLEPQRTNVITRSEEFTNVLWIKSRSSVTANNATSPNGLTTASRITETTFTNNFSGLELSTSAVNGTTYTQSIFVKKGNIDFFSLGYSIVGGASGGIICNLNTKQITLSVSIVSSSITDFADGWVRISITYTANATAANFINFFHTKNSNTINYNGNGTGFTYAWGAQLEVGAYQTSYIPTSSASVTRNADVISRGNIFTNGLITASGGTWFVELRGNVPRIRDGLAFSLGIGNTTSLDNNSLVFLYNSNALVRLSIRKYVGGSAALLHTTTSDTAKIAIKWNGSTADIFVNGVKVVDATSFTPTVMENFICNGTSQFINSMALFPTPLTDTQCIALTT